MYHPGELLKAELDKRCREHSPRCPVHPGCRDDNYKFGQVRPCRCVELRGYGQGELPGMKRKVVNK